MRLVWYHGCSALQAGGNMKSRRSAFAVTVFLLVIIASASVVPGDVATVRAQAGTGGTYFPGQIPPGTTPERFAPDMISMAGAIRGSIAFSLDGKYLFNYAARGLWWVDASIIDRLRKGEIA